ncbi:MAG: prepilin-type N-terminal cleavage/methylation domain-containing protein, partial [Pseudomonadota bacterium]
MLISAVGNNAARQRGLTLVELLVVIVIMAVVSGLAVAAIPSPESDVEKTARAFAASTGLLADAAVTSGQPTGLHVTATGWRALRYTEGRWTSIGMAEASGIAKGGVHLTLDLSDAFVLPEPEEDSDFVIAERRGVPQQSTDDLVPGIVFE